METLPMQSDRMAGIVPQFGSIPMMQSLTGTEREAIIRRETLLSAKRGEKVAQEGDETRDGAFKLPG